MHLIDVINIAMAGDSKRHFAKTLEVSRPSVTSWYTKGVIPSDDVLEKLAEITGMPVEKVFYLAYAEKIKNPIVSELLRHSATH